jgi:hypothetical protein
MMGFERFDARTRSYRNETRATVGISKAGRESLNVMASRALKDPERVFLSFDDEGRRIGLAQTPPDDPSSFKVAWPGKGVVRISYRAFLRHFGILVEKAQRSPARYETDGGGML